MWTGYGILVYNKTTGIPRMVCDPDSAPELSAAVRIAESYRGWGRVEVDYWEHGEIVSPNVVALP